MAQFIVVADCLMCGDETPLAALDTRLGATFDDALTEARRVFFGRVLCQHCERQLTADLAWVERRDAERLLDRRLDTPLSAVLV